MPAARATVVHVDRDYLTKGRAVPVPSDAVGAVPLVSCGQVARSQWAVIVDRDTGSEVADGRVGEIWLHGNNIALRYWGRPHGSRLTFGATLESANENGSRALGAPVDANWLRTGDLGVYLDGELYVTGRLADLVILDGRQHYPQDVETTTAEAATMVRRGYVTAFTVPANGVSRVPATGDALVVIAERASGTRRANPAHAVEAIREAVWERHGLKVADVRLVPAGAIPRTTSGKLARLASRENYLSGGFGEP